VYLLKLIFRNAFRHKLRTALTILGIVIAVLAFGLLQTVVDAWYTGVNASSATRLITRNAISLIFPLPITYEDKIRHVPGVSTVSRSNWFGGIYIDKRNFFAQFATDAQPFFELYPEYHLAPEQMKAFVLDRKACVVGRKLAHTYGWKLGDTIPLRGTIFPGNWDFVIRGIYEGAEAKTDESQFIFTGIISTSPSRRQHRAAPIRSAFILSGSTTPIGLRRFLARSTRCFVTPSRKL
jgi:putative ABC transport system permease protein